METKTTRATALPPKTKKMLLDMIDQIVRKTGNRDKNALCTIVCSNLSKRYKEETLERLGIRTTRCISQTIDMYLSRNQPLTWEEKVLNAAIDGPFKLRNQVVERAAKQVKCKDRRILTNHIYQKYQNDTNGQRAYYENIGLTSKAEILKAVDAYLWESQTSYTKIASFLL